MRAFRLAVGGAWLASVACGSDPEPPCAGSWGNITDPAGAVHVREGGDDRGEGTEEDPVASLSAALDLTRGGSLSRIVVGEGTFEAQLELAADPPGAGSDNGLVLEGCGPELTRLIPADADAPVVRVTEAEAVELRGFEVSGGRRAVWFWSGADVRVEDLIVDQPELTGFVVDGPSTFGTFKDVEVRDPRPYNGDIAYGMAVSGASVRWIGGGVSRAIGAAVVVDGSDARFTAQNVSINDSAATAGGAFGRGLQVQGFASATVADSDFAGHADVALFGLRAADLDVEASTFRDIGSDAIVATGIDADGRRVDPSTFATSLLGNSVDGASRAGIVLERVTADVSDNAVSATPSETARVSQEGAVVTGTDTVVELVDSLPLNRGALGGTIP